MGILYEAWANNTIDAGNVLLNIKHVLTSTGTSPVTGSSNKNTFIILMGMSYDNKVRGGVIFDKNKVNIRLLSKHELGMYTELLMYYGEGSSDDMTVEIAPTVTIESYSASSVVLYWANLPSWGRHTIDFGTNTVTAKSNWDSVCTYVLG